MRFTTAISINANIRTAMEHKSGDREQEHDSMERRKQPEAGEPSAQRYGRDEGNLYSEAEKTEVKNSSREERQNPEKSERPVEKAKII